MKEREYQQTHTLLTSTYYMSFKPCDIKASIKLIMLPDGLQWMYLSVLPAGDEADLQLNLSLMLLIDLKHKSQVHTDTDP